MNQHFDIQVVEPVSENSEAPPDSTASCQGFDLTGVSRRARSKKLNLFYGFALEGWGLMGLKIEAVGLFNFVVCVFTRQVEHYVERLVVLFEKRQCFNLVSFTSYAIELLKEPLLIFTKSGTKTLGGPDSVTARIKERCVQRMMSFVKLAICVIRAEWPHFELLASMRVFQLARPKRGPRVQRSADVGDLPHDQEVGSTYQTDVARLALAFHVDAAELDMQLKYVRPYAVKAFTAADGDNKPAWREVRVS